MNEPSINDGTEEDIEQGVNVVEEGRKSPMKEIIVTRDAFTSIDKASKEHGGRVMNSPVGGEGRSPKTLGSKSSDGSSIEWGIDVSKVQPSKTSLEANVAELQNIMASIQSLGSGEQVLAAEECDVQLKYSEDSLSCGGGGTATRKSGSDLHNRAGDDIFSPKSDASYLGLIDIRPIESSSTQDSEPSIRARQGMTSPSDAPRDVPGITFGRELMNSSRKNEDGSFSFRNIFNDEKNDLYECRAPSGPLGIVVDTTPLGPRVRSLNPLSPIFGKISPGDVVVGVDGVDTVGMEAGEFWKIVSRKANQQERILTILRI